MMKEIKEQIVIATHSFLKAYEEYKRFKDNSDVNKDMDYGNRVFGNLSEAVKNLERLRSEYDELIGFNEAQMLVHDFCLRVDTDEKGNMGFEELHSITKELPALVSNINPGLTQSILPNLVGITTGSTILLGDFKIKEGDKGNADIQLKRVKKIVDDAVNMISKEDSNVAEDSNRFALDNDLSDDQVYELVKGLSKITSGKSPVSEISFSNSKDYNETISLNKKGWKKSNQNFKKELDKLNYVEPSLYLEGQVRSVESWEDTHAFRIYTSDKPSGYNIHFNPEHFMKSEIAELMDNHVTIHRTKIGRLWFLDEIVSINKR